MGRNIFMIKDWLILFLLIITVFKAEGQIDYDEYLKLKEKYKDKSVIQLKDDVHYTIELHRGEPRIIYNKKETILYLKNVPGMASQRSLYVSMFRKLIDYEANTYILKGQGYKRLRVKNYKEVKTIDGTVFYDETKELLFTFPGIQEGSIIEFNRKFEITEPRAMGIQILKWYSPIHEMSVTYEVDKEIDMDLVEKNFENITNINFQEINKKKVNIYKYTLEDIPSFVVQDFQPDIRYFTPHIIPIIRGYNFNGQSVELLNNPEGLYKWYSTLVENVNRDIDEEGIKKLATDITKGLETDLEKVRAVYFWVQENIKYIAFEDDMGGYVPRKPDEVLNKRYGDCKDKSSLIKAMLNSLGIVSHFTWIGTRDIPYSYHEISSPLVDNHMIVTYIDGEDYYFLDGTGNYQSLSLPTRFIQGKEALIAKESGGFEIRKVPIPPAESNQFIDSVELRLTNSDIEGNGTLSLKGYPKIEIQRYSYADDKKELKDMLESKLEKGNNKFVLGYYTIEETGRFDADMDVEYDFTLNDYAQQVGDEIFLNLNLNQDWAKYTIPDDKLGPLLLKHKVIIKLIYKFMIPDGFVIKHLPDNFVYNNESFSFDVNYQQEKDYVIYNHSILINDIQIDHSQFSDWKEFMKGLSDAYKETMMISKKEYEK